MTEMQTLSRDWLHVGCENGHDWQTLGGRACSEWEEGRPCSMPGYASQPVFKCARCDTFDYGDPGGPGWLACQECASKCFEGALANE